MATKLSLTQVSGYSDAVESLAEESYGKALAYIESLDLANLDPADALEQVFDAVTALTDRYGDGAAYYAVNLYDDIVGASGTGASPALMAEGESGESIKKTASSWQGYLEAGELDAFSAAAANYVRASVRDRANATMMQNIMRDRRHKMGYALVPTSASPCEWCVMLISHGFVYATAGTAGASQHTNCRCKVVPGCDGLEIEGFDFDPYEALYAESSKAVSQNAAYADYNAMSAEERKKGGYRSFNDFHTKRILAAMRQLRKGDEFAI